jgi:hypothetical protein
VPAGPASAPACGCPGASRWPASGVPDRRGRLTLASWIAEEVLLGVLGGRFRPDLVLALPLVTAFIAIPRSVGAEVALVGLPGPNSAKRPADQPRAGPTPGADVPVAPTTAILVATSVPGFMREDHLPSGATNEPRPCWSCENIRLERELAWRSVGFPTLCSACEAGRRGSPAQFASLPHAPMPRRQTSEVLQARPQRTERRPEHLTEQRARPPIVEMRKVTKVYPGGHVGLSGSACGSTAASSSSWSGPPAAGRPP